MIKEIIKKVAGKLGYVVRSTKYIPFQFVENTNVLQLTLDHLISRHSSKRRSASFLFYPGGRLGWNGMRSIVSVYNTIFMEGDHVRAATSCIRKIIGLTPGKAKFEAGQCSS